MTRTCVPFRAPQHTPAHTVVKANYLDWLKDRHRRGRRTPRYVRREFKRFITCGDPEHAFTTYACPAGHFCRYVADRCKGRGWCPYCLTWRQRECGRHLVDDVFGNVPVRHWVECFPPCLREVIGYDPRLLNGGFSALVDAVFEYQRRRGAELLGVPVECIHPGCIVVNHRASAHLGVNIHFHGIFPAGVYVQLEPDGPVTFHRLPIPTDDEVAGVAFQACVNLLKVLTKVGFWATTSIADNVVEGQLTLPRCPPRRARFFGQAAKDAEGGLEPQDGAYAFHVFVGNAIEPEDRPQLEHLVMYILAPPFTDGQLTLDAAGNIVLWLKRKRHDGTAYVVFTPYEFLDRLADLVPRRNVNTVRYYGVYASNARLRKHAVRLSLRDRRRVSNRAPMMVCPICSAKLQVVSKYRSGGRDRADGWVPPDTPSSSTTRGRDRTGKATWDEGQGRLFG